MSSLTITEVSPFLQLPDIVSRYADLVAVYKPAGMLVHRQGPGQDGPFLLQWARDALGERVHLINRLDRPTAGLVLLATTPEAAAQAAAAFREHRVSKRYLAVVRGYVDGEETIDYALKPVRDRHASQQLTDPQSARTRYRNLQQTELAEPVGRYATARYTLLELTPETGRRHQLRRHMKHIFHPILGDRKYGDRDHNRAARKRGFDRLALVACRLDLELDGVTVRFASPPDAEWQAQAIGLGFRSADLLPLGK